MHEIMTPGIPRTIRLLLVICVSSNLVLPCVANLFPRLFCPSAPVFSIWVHKWWYPTSIIDSVTSELGSTIIYAQNFCTKNRPTNPPLDPRAQDRHGTGEEVALGIGVARHGTQHCFQLFQRIEEPAVLPRPPLDSTASAS